MDEIYEMKRYRCCNHVHKCGLTGWAGPTGGYMHYASQLQDPARRWIQIHARHTFCSLSDPPWSVSAAPS